MGEHQRLREVRPYFRDRLAGRAPWVTSEVGRLRCALLHRPGEELRVTARDPCGSLFAAAADPAAAAAEHDGFAEVLRRHGIEVLYVEELIAEIGSDPVARAVLLDTAIPPAAAATRVALAALAPAEVARALIAGDAGLGLDPLPNLMYLRDPSVWVGGGAIVGTMATRTRARESRLLSALYAAHPRFAVTGRWSDAARTSPRVEGGDVLAVGDDRVLIGISERTTRVGAHRLSRALLAAGAAHEVLVVQVPPRRDFTWTSR